MRLTKLERAAKRFRGNVLYDLLNILFPLTEESPCIDRVQKANHIAESADKRKDSRVCTFKKRKKTGKGFFRIRFFPNFTPGPDKSVHVICYRFVNIKFCEL